MASETNPASAARQSQSPGELIFGLLTDKHPRVSWEQHGDLMRTQLQETGRLRLYFITLADLWAVVDDLGIDPTRVHFREGYAEVRDEA